MSAAPTRRAFLRDTALAAGASLCVPGWLSAALASGRPPRARGDRRLVLLFLEGGNDGLNTVVPYDDERYHAARPKLAVSPAAVVRLDGVPGGEGLGLHPALAPWRALAEDGRLTVLQGVGYPRPDRSHFLSRDVWDSGLREAPEEARTSGWVARAAARAAAAASASLPPVGLGAAESPLVLRGERGEGLTLSDLDAFEVVAAAGEERGRDLLRDVVGAGSDTRSGGAASVLVERLATTAAETLDAASRLRASVERIPPGEGYPDTRLGRTLRLAARLCRAEAGPPVLWTSLGGFDTHALQAGTHAALLGQLAAATAAFQADLARDGSDARVLTLVHSEFGRRVAENGSAGTDHGAAAPLFALGPAARGGVLGAPPDLGDLEDGDLRMQTDFRAVFTEAVRDWLGWDARDLFDGPFTDGRAAAGLLA